MERSNAGISHAASVWETRMGYSERLDVPGVPLATSPGWRMGPLSPPTYQTDRPELAEDPSNANSQRSRSSPLLPGQVSESTYSSDGPPAATYPFTDADSLDPPPEFVCPISMSVMRDPVLLPTGQTYDRASIGRWLSSGRLTCPATGQQLRPPVALVPNVSLRSAICSWAKRHAPWLVDPNTDNLKRDSSLLAYIPEHVVPRNTTIVQGAPLRFEVQSVGSRRQQRGSPWVQVDAQRAYATRVAPLLWLAFLGAAYVATFVLSLWKSGWELAYVATNPFLGADAAGLVALGARSRTLVINYGEWWRIFSSPWVPPGVLGMASLFITAVPLARHATNVLPAPLISLPLIVVPSVTVGALISIILNVRYLSVGGAPPVAALLAIAWADQVVRGSLYKRRAFNLIVLLLITGIIAVLSLLPMQDFWGVAGAFACSWCLSCIGVLFREDVAQHDIFRRSLWRVMLGTTCALGFVAMAVVSSVGVAVKSDAGKACGAACRVLSCVPVRHWECIPIDAWSNGCGLSLADPDQAQNGGTLLCPGNLQINVPPGNKYLKHTPVFRKKVNHLCQQYCQPTADSGEGEESGEETPTAYPPPFPSPTFWDVIEKQH